MLRLMGLILTALLISCEVPHEEIDFEKDSKSDHSIEELLVLHEKAVERFGKDIYFTEGLGSFGRQGIHAALDYIEYNHDYIGSYNSMELIFGTAASAQINGTYWMCLDEETMGRIRTMNRKGSSSASEQQEFTDRLLKFCRTQELPN